MKRFINFIFIPIIIISIIGCSQFQGPEEQGDLDIIIEFPEENNEPIQTIKKVLEKRQILQNFDKAHCTVLKDGSIVWEDDLPQIGDYFTAEISLDAGSGYEVLLDYFINNQIAYSGSKSGIRINSGETTTAVVLMNMTLSALPSNLVATVFLSDKIDLNWIDNSVNEDGFKIERKSGATGVFNQITTIDANLTSYQDIGLSENTTYFYRIRAYNGAGNSGYSNIDSAITSIPTAPSNLIATTVSSSQINLKWIDNSIIEDGFKIERKKATTGVFSQISIVGENDTIYQDTSLDVNTIYYYRVRAYNSTGNSVYSDIDSSLTQPIIPNAPDNLITTAVSSSQINLKWNDNSVNEDGFKIECRTGSGGSYNLIATVGADITYYQNSGLNLETTYYYRILAFNDVGNSLYSNIAFDSPILPYNIVSSLNTNDYAFDVAISGNYVYIADNNSGLALINVYDPAYPIEGGYYDTYKARSVTVSGNFAYVADGSAGFIIIDISEESNPFEVGYYDTNDAHDVSVSGNFAYVADGSAGLRIIDILDVSNPFQVGLYDTYMARSVTVSGNFAYVADGNNGLRIIDISEASNPYEVGHYDVDNIYNHSAYGVTLLGNFAYMAYGTTGLRIIDISEESNPFEVGYYDTGNALGVTVSGNFAYVADGNSGLRAINIFDKVNPIGVGDCDTPGSAQGIAISGNYVYVADYDAGLQIIYIGE